MRTVHVSQCSLLICAVGAPIQPSLSIAGISSTTADLEWTQDLTQPVTTYVLRWTYTGPCSVQLSLSTVISGTQRQFSLTGLEEAGNYTFGLMAINEVDVSSEATVIGLTLPAGSMVCS